jgi:hypothetical protein
VPAIAQTIATQLGCLILASLIMGLVLLNHPQQVFAQNLAPAPLKTSTEAPIPRDPASIGSIPAEKINQFIQAYLQVINLVETRQFELQGAESESESLRIQQALELEAFAIIEAAGLTRQEYLQLLNLANTDPEFGERTRGHGIWP